MLRLPHTPLPHEQDDVEYEHGPDSSRQQGVTAGRTVELRVDDPPSGNSMVNGGALLPDALRWVWRD